MSLKAARKIGFIGALAMLVGTVVGTGIYFKNKSVLEATSHDGLTSLFAWIVGGLLALFAAISFSNIESHVKTGSAPGLPGWAENLGNKKFGYFVRFNMTTLYFAILFPVIGFFVSELFFQFLEKSANVAMPPVWVHAMVGLLFMILALITNLVSIKYSGYVQTIITIIKFVPLIVALVVGILLPTTHNSQGQNYFSTINFTFTGLIASLPGILFAYDAFLGVTSLPSKTKGGPRTVSKVILVGMIMVIVLYSLLSVSALLHGGFIGDIISDSLPPAASKWVNIVVFGFLFVSGYGVINGMCAAVVSYSEMTANLNMIYGINKLKKMSFKKKSIITAICISMFGYLISVVPAVAFNTDEYVDALSNFPTLFFFVIYAIVIILYFQKHRTKISTTKKVIGYLFSVCSILIVAYQIFYAFTIKLFISGEFITKSTTGVGLFVNPGHWTDLHFFLTFLSFTILFIALPSLNKLILKKFNKQDVLIDTLSKKEKN